MINVPTTVKDALKDGGLLKNYRFIVKNKVTTRDPIIPIYTFNDSNRQYTISSGYSGGYYMYFDASQPTCTLVGRVNFPAPSNGYYPFTIQHTTGTETLALVQGTSSGAVIDLSASIILPTFPTILLTAGELITYSDTYTDDFVIDNDNIVKESVKIDERMASGETLKFGLAEGSSLEFQYFDKPNIRGRRIYAELEVEYNRGAGTWTDYFDLWNSGQYTAPVSGTYRVTAYKSSSFKCGFEVERNGVYVTSGNLNNNKPSKTVELMAGDLVTTTVVTPPSEMYIERFVAGGWHTIPMGWFDVAQCPVQLSTGIRKVLAYNRLTSNILDTPVGELIDNIQSDTTTEGEITIQTIQSLLLDDFNISEADTGTVVLKTYADTATFADCSYVENGTTTTRYMYVSYYNYHASVSPDNRVEINMEPYLAKVYAAHAGIKSAIYANCKNPDTVWENYLNSFNYLSTGAIACIFGSGNTYNGYYPPEMPPVVDTRFTVGLAGEVKYLYGTSHIVFKLPYKIEGSTSSSYVRNSKTLWENGETLAASDITVRELTTDNIQTITINKALIDKGQVTLRDIINANYELHCQYGHIDRETNNFSGVELATATAESVDINSCSKLWTDTSGEQSFRNLVITYKTLDSNNQEKDEVYTITVNSDGTTDYIMDNNWLLRNKVWDSSDVYTYGSQMADKMASIRWTPFEAWPAGLPYIETGDKLEITDNHSTFTSYVLQRQLKGIQNLQDTYINGTLDIF